MLGTTRCTRYGSRVRCSCSPVLCAVLFAMVASSARAADVPFTAPPPTRAFKCDGTDAFFFDELNKAGTVGYGETWDAHVCDDGAEVYAAGATAKWRAFRPRPQLRATPEEQAMALVLPLVVFGGLGAVALAAAAIAFAARLRRLPAVMATCPACAAQLPIEPDAGVRQHLFCPMCGAPCSVQLSGRGKAAQAHVTTA